MNAEDKCDKEKNKGPKLEINSDGGLWGWLPGGGGGSIQVESKR